MEEFTDTYNTVTAGRSVLRPQRNQTNRRQTIGLVPFLFGVAQTDQLAGVVLVRLLGELGLGVAAARQQLSRMRNDGQLNAIRRGRGVDYQLAGPFAATFRRLRSSGEPPPPWAGQFRTLLYQMPEAQRAYRDRLRRSAQLLGYGLLQPGVLISVPDLSDELAAVLAAAPPGCHIHRGTLHVSTTAAAAIARTAWDLDELADAFREQLATLSLAMGAHGTPPATAGTLRRLSQLRNTPLVDLISDPGLPPQLLPANWPGPELAHLMKQVRDRYLPPAAQYIHAVSKAAVPEAPRV